MERQTITVDIAPGNNQIQRLKSSQGDIGRPLGVYITQNGIALDCSTYTADLYILKPDGNYFTATVTVDATEHNLITWETAKQETPVAGDCAAQIRILSNGDDIGTARFVEYVEASPGFCGEASESVVESLMEYVRQAAASAETASGAATSATGSASAASGSASAAASSASAAAGSASSAHTDAETASQAAQTAQDVADSIPEDYSTLSDDVTGLKSALNYSYDEKALFVGEWKIGLIGGNVGSEIEFNPAFTNRVSLTTPQEFDYDITLFVQSGYKASIFFIDDNNIILSVIAVNEGSSYTITAGNIFEILMEKVPVEVVGTHMFDYIQAIKHTMRNYLLYDEIDNAKAKIDAERVALENLFSGSMYYPGMEYGSTNAETGAYNANEKHHITTPEWFIPEYPYEIRIKDAEYSCRLLYNDDGVISYENLTTEGNLLYPNRQTKIDLWKTNSIAILDLDTAKNILSFQSISDYLAVRSKMCADKLNEGKCLFDQYVRRGSLGNGTYINYVSYRCATPNIIRYSHDITIIPETGFRFSVHTFTALDVFDADLGWKTSAFKISAGQGFKLIIARTTESSSEVADPDVFIMGISLASDFATKNDLQTIPMFNNGFLQTGGKPKLAAHQGYHVDYPGNSIPAYQEAGRKGYWGIETDVNQTSDNKFVMIHDATVDATTDGTGAVNEMTLAQIRALHLTGTNLQVPTLEEYLGICKRYGCVPIIEVKSTVSDFASFVEVLKTFGFDKSCIVIGSKWSISGMKNAAQYIPYMSIYQNGFTINFDEELAYNAAYENSGMDWDYDLTDGVDLTKAKKLHDLGMLFGTFMVDNADNVLDAFEKGVDFVTTNTVLPIDVS